ncbi:MAG TPA: response regulator transcription factor [Chloroflexota bacterium]
MNGHRILIVDDDQMVIHTLRRNLIARGYDVAAVETGDDVLLEAAERRPDLIILDLILPEMSGLALCKAIRAESAVPILVVSARVEERTKVRALDLGADDYVTKPFGIEELLARVRALLRRPPVSLVHWDAVIQVGELILDTRMHEVRQDGVRLDLTAREFALLSCLMRHAGEVIPHRLLLSEVWGPAYGWETPYLRVYINRLRRKIERDSGHPRHILTEPGVGYRFVVQGAPQVREAS